MSRIAWHGSTASATSSSMAPVTIQCGCGSIRRRPPNTGSPQATSSRRSRRRTSRPLPAWSAPPPNVKGIDLQLSVNAEGRLSNEEQFGDIVVNIGTRGEVVRLRDVARIELGASQYGLRSLLDNKQAVAIPIFQAPGSNALEISDHVRATMAEIKKNMPEGVSYQI